MDAEYDKTTQARGTGVDKTYNLFGAPPPTLKRSADLDGADFYPTPAWATFALIEHEMFRGSLWESACGDGAMARVLEHTRCQMYNSDLYDRGFGDHGVDYLQSNLRFDNIITNPPFHSAEGFVQKSLKLANQKFALLLRLAFLEGGGRQRTIFSNAAPSRVWVFSERITFYPKSAPKKGSGTTAYAWFVWDKSHIGGTELKWIPPGSKQKHS